MNEFSYRDQLTKCSADQTRIIQGRNVAGNPDYAPLFNRNAAEKFMKKEEFWLPACGKFGGDCHSGTCRTGHDRVKWNWLISKAVGHNVFPYETYSTLAEREDGTPYELPDYIADMNKMNEATATLTDVEFDIFCAHLEQIFTRNAGKKYDRQWVLIRATPLQHGEAFLRTKELLN